MTGKSLKKYKEQMRETQRKMQSTLEDADSMQIEMQQQTKFLSLCKQYMEGKLKGKN